MPLMGSCSSDALGWRSVTVKRINGSKANPWSDCMMCPICLLAVMPTHGPTV